MALIPVFMPPLVVLLHRAEQVNDAPLTREEALAIRDKGVCVMLDEEMSRQIADQRGYPDIDPERCWEEWQVARQELNADT